MAKFDGSKLTFDWHLGGTSFEGSGANLSKSYDNITYSSRSQIRTQGVLNMWGKNYRTRATINGSFGAQNSSLNNLRISYGKGNLTVSNIKGISLEDFGDSNLDRFNSKYLKHDDEIIASSNNDKINARTGDDFIWGNKGDDSLSGGAGNDLLVGGKGIDFLYGGSGSDSFGISKKMGKGPKNYDIVMDFEDGKDFIYAHEGTKGLSIRNSNGDAGIFSGNDMLAFIPDAAGKLSLEGNGNFIS